MTRAGNPDRRRAGRRSGRTARGSGAATWCSARASSGSIPRPASSPTASRPRPSARCATSQSVLDAAGLSFDDVVKTTIFLADIGDFAAVNAVYARFMPDPPPARSTFQVGALPKGGLVEIEAIARRVQVDAVAR